MQTCCDYHGIDCNQGRDCPARKPVALNVRAVKEYAVRVFRPGVAPYKTRVEAESTTGAICNALADGYEGPQRVSVIGEVTR